MEAEGYSYTVGHDFVYKWYVKDIKLFIKCADKNEVTLDSPEFSANAKFKDLWCLRLGISCSDPSFPLSTYFSVSLAPKNGERQVRVKYTLYFLNTEGKRISPSFGQFDIQVLAPQYRIFRTTPVSAIFVNADKLLKKSDEFFHNDTLTIGVDLTVYDDYEGINNPINFLKGSGPLMADDFERLLISKEKSDIVIKVGNEKFYAHKFILTTRSSVFDAMFSHNLEEKTTNEINIPDIDSKVFEKLLIFIYTDKVEELDNFAEDLLEASDKYQLQRLKEKCEDHLGTNFTLENVLRVMILADRHSAKRLKKAAVTYILVNFTDVKKSEDYKALEKSEPSLASELLRRYLDNNK